MYVLQELPIETHQRRLGPGLLAILANASLVALLAMGIGVAPKMSKPQVESSDVYFIPDEPKRTEPFESISDDVPLIPIRVPIPDRPDISIEQERQTTSTAATTIRTGDGETGSVAAPVGTQARILRQSEPQYPVASIRAHEEGVVMLQVLISQNGRVDDVRIATSSGFARLDDAAIKEVRTWRFAPATRSGQAIATWVNVPVKFELR